MDTNYVGEESFRDNFEAKLTEYEEHHSGSTRTPWTEKKVLEVIRNIQNARAERKRRTAMEYYWMSKYDVMTVEDEDFLIFKRKSPDDPTVRIIPRNEYFGVLLEAHESCGHGGRDKVTHAIKSRFYIPKKAIEIFLALCPTCKTKKNFAQKGIAKRPILSQDFNIRGQVDLLDFQSNPDGEFKWLLIYQDNATKFLNLRPLKTNGANEVAMELMKIFLIFGAPYILQSVNGREFTAKVVDELSTMWPECKIIHGSPTTSQIEESVENSNHDIESLLRAWMTDNNSESWSLGCYHVQYKKNASFHNTIGSSPYKALFGSDPKAGINSSAIPPSILMNIETEEELRNIQSEPSGSNNLHGDPDTTKYDVQAQQNKKIDREEVEDHNDDDTEEIQPNSFVELMW